MKKYILFLFVSTFIISLLAANASFARAYDSGCTSFGPYSTTTGMLCDTINTVVSCKAGDLFSSLTGQRCTSWDNYDSTFSDLKIGSRGEYVRAFQQMLKDAGFLFGNVDGIYGRITDGAATRYYQKYPRTVFPPISGSPIISGVSGPQSLVLNETGTWTVSAYNSNGGNLSYSVVWGDEGYQYGSSASFVRPVSEQTATFTHSYSYSGTFKPVFTVTNFNGQSAQMSLSVVVNGIQSSGNLQIYPSNATIKVGGTVTLQSLFNTCPAGAQCFVGSLPVQSTWTSSNVNVATVIYENTCVSGVYCIMLAPNYLNAVVTGISTGTAVITATYQRSPSGPLFQATAFITVEGANNQNPSISFLSPTYGHVGTQVTIYGSGFTATGNRIKFGNLNTENNPSYNLSSNGTSITFTIPSGNYYSCWYTNPACYTAAMQTQPGIYQVSVINANGISNVVNFTVATNTIN